MYKALELTVDGRLIRGCLRAPDGDGPFPTVIFFHGFTVDKVGMMRLHDDALVPQPRPLPSALLPTVALIDENCEPALATFLFMAGAGGSLRAGVTSNPVRLTRAVQSGAAQQTQQHGFGLVVTMVGQHDDVVRVGMLAEGLPACAARGLAG